MQAGDWIPNFAIIGNWVVLTTGSLVLVSPRSKEDFTTTFQHTNSWLNCTFKVFRVFEHKRVDSLVLP